MASTKDEAAISWKIIGNPFLPQANCDIIMQFFYLWLIAFMNLEVNNGSYYVLENQITNSDSFDISGDKRILIQQSTK